MNNSRGFTIIELLVVVSIIGLLSAIMLTSLAGAKDKARIGSSLEFASSLDNALGGSPLAWWDFSDCGGTQLTDKSGNFLHGDIAAGGSATWNPDIPYVNQTCSLTFNGTSQYVPISSSGKTHSGAYTISVWVKPLSVAQDNMGVFGSQTGTGNAFSMKLRSSQNLDVSIGSGAASLGTVSATLKYVANSWYHLAVVVKTTDCTVYIDGKVAAACSAYSGTPLLYDATRLMRIGSTNGTSEFFNGRINFIRLFGSALSANEIEQIYASEKPKALGLR